MPLKANDWSVCGSAYFSNCCTFRKKITVWQCGFKAKTEIVMSERDEHWQTILLSCGEEKKEGTERKSNKIKIYRSDDQHMEWRISNAVSPQFFSTSLLTMLLFACTACKTDFHRIPVHDNNKQIPKPIINLKWSEAKQSILNMMFQQGPHARLVQKVTTHSIQGEPENWIQNWLCGKGQRLVVKGWLLDWLPVSRGVPLGPPDILM